ncbi:MAG: SMI1/KNR4 family protein [Scytonematopsis contorta HA4267-MV1]|jgi:cell wall assembly regulator SMI1|nr:SMI1/KNR4 family protein [Scytonematopsis contorta HA4267-MV1]
MVALTDALERIMNWLRENQADYANSFATGLKYDEIFSYEEELGFKLPGEIYELYQWRNGTEEDAKALCFPTMQFLPMNRAIEYSQGCNEYIESGKESVKELSEWYDTSPLFAFIEDNGNFCGIPLINHQKEKSPVVVLGEGEMPYIFYTSLTDMMFTLAECYETGAYYLKYEGYVCSDEYQEAQVLRKYNADISERALLAFQSLLVQPLDFSDKKLLEQVAELAIVIGRFKDPRGVDLLLSSSQKWSKQKGLYRDGVYFWVVKALGEMFDVRVLKALDNALKDNSPFVREEAEKALSKIKEYL